jgi:hypothetical protein
METIKLNTKASKKHGYCPYCKRYIGSGYIGTEHKKLCKNVSVEVRKIHGGE